MSKIRKFLKNPIKGQRAFLQAIEATSGLMQRFLVVENTYCITDETSHLESSVVELYFRILVFQARALRHLDHRLTRTILSDTFNPSQWDHRLQKIREQEEECNKLLSDETRRQIESQSGIIQELRKKVEDSFSRQLAEIRVSLLPDRHNPLVLNCPTRKLTNNCPKPSMNNYSARYMPSPPRTPPTIPAQGTKTLRMQARRTKPRGAFQVHGSSSAGRSWIGR